MDSVLERTGSLAAPKLNVDKGLDIVVGQSPAILLRVVDIQVALHYVQCLLVGRDAGDVLELGPDIAFSHPNCFRLCRISRCRLAGCATLVLASCIGNRLGAATLALALRTTVVAAICGGRLAFTAHSLL